MVAPRSVPLTTVTRQRRKAIDAPAGSTEVAPRSRGPSTAKPPLLPRTCAARSGAVLTRARPTDWGNVAEHGRGPPRLDGDGFGWGSDGGRRDRRTGDLWRGRVAR